MDPFQTKSTKKGLRIEKIRKDTAAYQIGIKEGELPRPTENDVSSRSTRSGGSSKKRDIFL